MELKPEDLFNTCETCNGEKQITFPPQGSYGGIGIMTQRGPETCHACNGLGFTVTSTGHAIAQLMDKVKDNYNGAYGLKIVDSE